jgi:hypothetical protein
MILFAALVSPVFAALHRHDWASAKAFAARLFAALIGGALILSWLLYVTFG